MCEIDYGWASTNQQVVSKKQIHPNQNLQEKWHMSFWFPIQLWPWMKVKVTQTDIKMHSLEVSINIIITCLKEISQYCPNTRNQTINVLMQANFFCFGFQKKKTKTTKSHKKGSLPWILITWYKRLSGSSHRSCQQHTKFHPHWWKMMRHNWCTRLCFFAFKVKVTKTSISM